MFVWGILEGGGGGRETEREGKGERERKKERAEGIFSQSERDEKEGKDSEHANTAILGSLFDCVCPLQRAFTTLSVATEPLVGVCHNGD